MTTRKEKFDDLLDGLYDIDSLGEPFPEEYEKDVKHIMKEITKAKFSCCNVSCDPESISVTFTLYMENGYEVCVRKDFKDDRMNDDIDIVDFWFLNENDEYKNFEELDWMQEDYLFVDELVEYLNELPALKLKEKEKVKKK